MILRIQYRKNGMMKFLSHLDMVRLVERSLRRGNMPLKFSQGYNPHPKIAFAAPLSVGVTSDYELVDIELTEEVDLNTFKEMFPRIFPGGIQLVRCQYLESSKSLMSMVSDCAYAVKVAGDEETLAKFAKFSECLMDQDELIVVKKSKEKRKPDKEVNIRPLIKEFAVLDVNAEEVILRMKLASGSVGNLKPDTVVEQIAKLGDFTVEPHNIRIHRVMLFGDEGKTELYVLS